MKNRLGAFKTAQLVITVMLSVAALTALFTDDGLYQAVGHDASVRLLCIILWLALVLSFVSILVDFMNIRSLNMRYHEMDYTVSNDPVAGIANRYSCDAVIERYADKPLPKDVGCIMLEISNLRVINSTYGHVIGNATIQAFSDALSGASVGLCFVGRNGGNKFLALFEQCSEEKLSVFMTRVRQKIDIHNGQPDAPWIDYNSGRAFNEGDTVTGITQLIALADRRISSRSDPATGIPNRDSCDEVIARYLDKPLPKDLGAAMLELINLKEINNAYGRATGNRMLRRFSDILREASGGTCFVGRNGGLRFLALFEHSTRGQMEAFCTAV